MLRCNQCPAVVLKRLHDYEEPHLSFGRRVCSQPGILVRPATLEHPSDNLGPGIEIQFGKDVCHVSLCSGDRDYELHCDLTIAVPARDERSNFKLALREWLTLSAFSGRQHSTRRSWKRKCDSVVER